MAVQVQMKGRLFGNSMFWVFTRVKDNIEVNKPVCILKKMPDSQRVFCIFGQMVERVTSVSHDSLASKPGSLNAQMVRADETMDEVERIKMLTLQSLNQQSIAAPSKLQFKFFKNQEIPEFFYDLESDAHLKRPKDRALSEDYVDFSVTLVDNGDDRLCLQVALGQARTLNLVCQMFVPVFEPSKILFAGKTAYSLIWVGSGHATYLKEVKIRQTQRQEFFKSGMKEGHFECCSVY